jgi:gp32-like DNA binding protein
MADKVLTPEERMRKDYEEAKKRASNTGGRFFKPEEGDNVIRILPPWKAGENFYRKISVHYGVVQENSKVGVYCPKENRGEECPMCEQAQALFEKGGKESMKKAGGMRAKIQYISNVHIQSTPSGEMEGDVRTYTYGVTVFTGLVDLMMGKWGNIYDAVKGRAVCIKRSGVGRDDTDYNVIPEPDAGPVTKEVLGKMFNLDDNEGVVEVFTADEISELMNGASLDAIRAARDGGEEKAEEKPAAKKAESKPVAKPASKAAEGPGPAPVDKKLLKRLIGAAVEEDINLDAEEPEAIIQEFKEKTQDLKVKSLSKDTVALLEEMGASVSNKTVAWEELEEPAAEAEPEAAEGDDDDDIKAQMERLRSKKKK